MNKQNNNRKKKNKGFGFYVIVFLVLLGTVGVLMKNGGFGDGSSSGGQTIRDASYSDIQQYFFDEKVDTFEVYGTELTMKLKDGTKVEYVLATPDQLREDLGELIEAQKQKAALLADQIKALENAGEGETAQCYKLKKQLAETNTKINEYTNGQQKAGKETGVSTGQIIKAGAALGAMKVAASAVVGALKGIAKAAINAAKGVWNLGVESGQWADELITNSNQAGVDVETLQEWGYAARFIDTEVSTMTSGMKKLTQAYAKGTSAKKKSVKLTKGVTVSLKKENGEIKSQAEFYLDVVDQLHGMTNVAQRNAAAQKIFGKSYTDMLPLIESGTTALRQYSAEARNMGVIISADNVGALGQFDDKMQRFDATIGAIKTNLAVAFLPVLELVSGRLLEFSSTVSTILSDGLQKEDVGNIVDAFFNMFRLDSGDQAGEDQNALAFIGELISLLASKVAEHSDDIKRIATTIFTYIADGFKEAMGITGLKEKIFGEEGTFLGFKVEEGSVADKLIQGWKAIVGIFDKDTSTDTANQDAGAGIAEGIAEGIEDTQQPVEEAADETVGTVEKKTGPSAHSKSTHWGHELASGYADGIRAGIPEVSAASEAMARAAAAPIHYSLPDYGPLREVGKWGGEMIDKYVAGINKNVWKVGNAINGALPVAGSTTNYGGVTIVVNGTAGQDVNALADIVMSKMQNAVNRREAVFA